MTEWALMLIEMEKANVTEGKAAEISAFLGRAGSSFLPGALPCPGSPPRSEGRSGRRGRDRDTPGIRDRAGSAALGCERAEPPGSLPAARAVPRLDLLTVLDLFVIAFAAVVLLHSLPQKRNNSQGYQTTTSRSTTMQEPQPATAPGMPYGPPQQVPGTYQGAGNYGFQAQPMGFPGGFGVPPVQNQPNMNGAIWMPIPPSIPNCPPGLEYLTQIDQILIQQQLELLEIVTGFETSNKYELKNALGQRVYFAAEDTDCLTRNFCGSARPFTLRIIDNLGHEVITLHRPLRCSSCCCPCCLQELEVQAPPGTTVGYVVQNWHAYLPKFTIQDEKRTDILKIIGPCIVCRCCEDVNFEVTSVDETSAVGRISKKWTGFVQEAFTDTDTFGISFPMDLDVKMKAVMIGACFLIDFMFFEYSGN